MRRKNCRDKRVIRERGWKCRKIVEREMANSETKLKELLKKAVKESKKKLLFTARRWNAWLSAKWTAQVVGYVSGTSKSIRCGN